MSAPVATEIHPIREGYVTKDPVSGIFGSSRRRWLILRTESTNGTEVHRICWFRDAKQTDPKKMRGDLLVTRDTKVEMKKYGELTVSTFNRKLSLRATEKTGDASDASAIMQWKDAVEALVMQLAAAGPSMPGGGFSSSSAAVRP